MRHSSSRKKNCALKFKMNKQKHWDEHMKKIFLSLSAFLLMSLSACAVHTPHGSVVVDPEHNHGGYGDFCPPGQAKKGRC